MNKPAPPRVLALCAASTGLDAIAEVLRQGFAIEAIVGLDPETAKPDLVSGFIDVKKFATKWNIPSHYVRRYDLKDPADREKLQSLNFNLLWVSAWQRLVPDWLLAEATLGAFGGHGSPDGIHGGRGRSPQNWAIMLGCKRFDLALFSITPGVDEGPIIAQRSFFYNDTDDISTSYKKSSLCMSEMVTEVLRNPDTINTSTPQQDNAYYYPQRKPEDGHVDWSLTQHEINAHCRALTRPYPGLRTKHNETEITIWECTPFDDKTGEETGTIDFAFEDGTFLVSCRDGRILIKDYQPTKNWTPTPGMTLYGPKHAETMKKIIKRHYLKYPNAKIAKRILQHP